MILKKDKNFGLVGYLMSVTYDDFRQFDKLFINTNYNEVKENIEKIVSKKENCDEEYQVSLEPIFEILNKKYEVFSNFIEGSEDLPYFGEDFLLDKTKFYISGKVEKYSIKTLKKNIPENLALLSKIKEIDLIDDNGNTNQSGIDEMIGKLNLLKRT